MSQLSVSDFLNLFQGNECDVMSHPKIYFPMKKLVSFYNI